jgi:hypothetical protein
MNVKLEPSARCGYFWGIDDKPAINIFVAPDVETPAEINLIVRIANHRREHLREMELKACDISKDNPYQYTAVLDIDRYGVYFVTMEVRIGKFHTPETRICWLAEKAEIFDDSPFAVSTHFSQKKYDDIPFMLDKIKEMGASWIRDGFYWHAVELQKGVYTEPEYIVDYAKQVRESGLNILWVLALGNPLYNDKKAPATDEERKAYAGYAKWSVENMADYCRVWEIWNEPDNQFWQPKSNPEHYAALVNTTCEVVKDTAERVGARMMAGAASWFKFDFLEKTFQHGAGKSCDIYSIHPYGLRGSPDAGKLVEHTEKLHDMMSKYGAGDKKIWFTEFGYLTMPAPGGFTESYAAAYLVHEYVLALSLPYVERLFFYDIRDDGVNPTDPEDHMGLMFADGSAKVGFAAYNTMARKIGSRKFTRVIDFGSGTAGYEYSGDDGNTVIVWSLDGAAVISLSTDENGVVVTDMMGNAKRVLPVNGQLVLPVSYEPVFITDYTRIDSGCQVAVLG